MLLLSIINPILAQKLYGQPIQTLYGPGVMKTQDLYGPYFPPPSDNMFTSIFRLLTTPFFVIASFSVGVILFLLTKKKIFIIIPLIIGLVYCALKLLLTFSGISL